MWQAVITFADLATLYLFYVATSEEAVVKYKLTPLARLVGYGVAGCDNIADRATFYLFYVATSEEAVVKYKLTPLARLVGYGVAGCDNIC